MRDAPPIWGVRLSVSCFLCGASRSLGKRHGQRCPHSPFLFGSNHTKHDRNEHAMSDTFVCPHCEQYLDVAGVAAGEPFTCPACQGEITFSSPVQPVRVARLVSPPQSQPRVAQPPPLNRLDASPPPYLAGVGEWHIKKQWAIAVVIGAFILGLIVGKSTSFYHVSISEGRIVRTNTLTGQTWVQYSGAWHEIREP